MKSFQELQDAIVLMLKDSYGNFGDHLGHIYMQYCHKGNHKGQFFTPYHISYFMAKITMNNDMDDRKAEIDKKGYISINDPCCGAGGMLVAACNVLDDEGINYTEQAVVYGNDIDVFCVHMSFLQLAFIGASAYLEHKNTITQETWDTFRTPAFLLTEPRRRELDRGEELLQVLRKVMTATAQEDTTALPEVTEEIIEKAKRSPEQLDFFSIADK
jgi:type I restriction-modification system DNA methylase subunit